MTRPVLLWALAGIFVLGACSASPNSSTTEGGGAPAGANAACPPAAGTAARTTSFAGAPPMCIDPAKSYTATIETSAGGITATIDSKSAPLAANNFVFLARNHFYDGVTFHRIIPDFVIQGGDATGSPPGSGGPGYQFKDELPKSPDVYQPGALAMANSGSDTNGSQFFIVLAPGRLQAKYSLFGQVTQGLDTTVQAIARTGTSKGTPSSATTIKSIIVTEN